MAAPSPADLAALLQTLVETVETLKTSVAELQQERRSNSSSSGARTLVIGEHHHDRPPRFQKMDFPKYDGKTDPLAFINRCESYFHQQRIIEEEQVWMASYNLEDVAQLWFIQVQQDEGTPPWRRFTELLNLRFGPPLRSNPLGELAACKRTGSVVDYQDRFQALLPRAGRLTEAQRVQLFTAGLQPPLSLDVEVHNPQSLSVAMSLARKLELREHLAAPAAPPRTAGRGLLPAPRALPALPASAAATPTITVEGRPVKKLSQTEMEERRRLGLCYNCNDKFSRGHNKVCPRLFFLDFADAADDDGMEETEAPDDAPLISLHAIAGIRTSETMKVLITMGGATLHALLDSGSTHNFIAEDSVAATGLLPQRRDSLSVTVANGDRVPCVGMFRSATFAIEQEHFTADFYVLPLAGYDIVLGTQWLATLGPILWDFGQLSMSFWRGTQPVCWRGIAGQPAHAFTRPRAATSSTRCWQSSRTSSSSRTGCHRRVPTTTTSPYYLVLPPWPCAHTDIHRRTRMSWNGSVATCCSRA